MIVIERVGAWEVRSRRQVIHIHATGTGSDSGDDDRASTRRPSESAAVCAHARATEKVPRFHMVVPDFIPWL
jgi:hypothetical protein